MKKIFSAVCLLLSLTLLNSFGQKVEQHTPPAYVNGKITSAETDRSLPNVLVKRLEDNTQVRTDGSGRFRMEISGGNPVTLVFDHPAHRVEELVIEDLNSPIRIHLTPRKLSTASYRWLDYIESEKAYNSLNFREDPEWKFIFRQSDLKGDFASDSNYVRRDPTAVIQVGQEYHVYYTKGLRYSDGPEEKYFPWDQCDIWHATSKDGWNWEEKGLAVERGSAGSVDDASVFTPEVLAHKGKYYLVYQQVQAPYVYQVKNTVGLAYADHPAGPWTKLPEPVLTPTNNGQWAGETGHEVLKKGDFDSHKVHDPCLMFYKGRFYLYYKGERMGEERFFGQREIRWGVAIAEDPLGPYVKSEFNPLTTTGHEVCVWHYKGGIALVHSADGPEVRTVQWAPDGIHFEPMARVNRVPTAPGLFRSDDTNKGPLEGIRWGLCHTVGGDHWRTGWNFLKRFDIERDIPAESPASNMVYDSIRAPVFVGRPLSDAYIGLSRLENGEIRYYDFGEQSQIENEEIREEMRPARKYIYSRDNGLTWYKKTVPDGFIGADIRSPVSGEYLRMLVSYDSILVVRSNGGINGSWTRRLIGRDRFHMFAPPLFIRDGKRVLVSCHKLHPNRSARVYYSDDDGFTWKYSEVDPVPDHVPTGAHRGPRWQNPGIEPTVVELKDGRLWMIIRCSQDLHYQSYSSDGGESWSTPEPSPFYGTITMPRIGRLKDGRLLFIWNNTTPLPEISPDDPVKSGLAETSRDGTWEDVFTNRAAIHAAISDDEGLSWTGFRELYLDPRRDAADYAESGGVDHSVHQNQFIDLEDGKILVAFGQHPLHRSMVLFDTEWLYEKSRSEDFSGGLENWSVHTFVAEIRGHCSFNRKAGARLVDHPQKTGNKVLRVARPEDSSLLIENEGAVWNFPAGKKGTFTTRIFLPEGSQGARINLTDRWFNPVDTSAYQFSMFTVPIKTVRSGENDVVLKPGSWHTLIFEWSGLEIEGEASCLLTIHGTDSQVELPLNRSSLNGISYVHFISTANIEDQAGLLVESVSATIN